MLCRGDAARSRLLALSLRGRVEGLRYTARALGEARRALLEARLSTMQLVVSGPERLRIAWALASIPTAALSPAPLAAAAAKALSAAYTLARSGRLVKAQQHIYTLIPLVVSSIAD